MEHATLPGAAPQADEFKVGGIIRITEFIKNEVKGKAIIIILGFETLSKEGLLVEVGDCWSQDPNYELFVQPYAMGRLMQLRRYYGFPSGCD